MSSNKIYIDLHIHTPASDDYKGPKNDDEYKRILKNAYENNIKVLGITDHTTINGYKKIMDLKMQTMDLVRTLHKRSDVDKSFLNTLEKELELFNSLHILMGIELNVSPGIHYVIIFKENVSVEQVEEFLFKITQDNFSKNVGLSNYMIDINSKQLFETVDKKFGQNCFIYAPHCDSQSGVIESLKNLGTERLNILKDDRLLCLGFNKETSREYVIKSLIPQICKERKTKLNFIQDSDYHGRSNEKVGLQHFIIEVENEKVDFDILLNKLITQDKIKTTLDTSLERYEFFKKNNILFDCGIIDGNDHLLSNEDKICQTMCAIINSNKGNIQFTLYLSGYVDYQQKIEEYFQQISNFLSDRINITVSKIFYTQFQISKSQQIIIIRHKRSNRLCTYKGRCYFLDNNNKLKLAKAFEIEHIVAKKIYNRLGVDKDKLVDSISKYSSKIKNSLLSFSNVYKIDPYIYKFKDYQIDLKNINYISDEFDKFIHKVPNGNSTGNAIIIEDIDRIKCGRYKDSYLRLTVPIFEVPEKLVCEYENVRKGSILIFPEGAVFLVTKDIKLVSSIPSISLSLNEDVGLRPEVFALYLKSTFLQWYISKIYNYDDIFSYLLSSSSNGIPFISGLRNCSNNKLDKIANDLIIKEMSFLDEIAVSLSKGYENNDITEKIITHNNEGDDFLRSTDQYLFELLKLDKTDIRIIFNDIKNLDVYDYKALEIMEGI